MNLDKLSKSERIHFIGIGGAGMSAIAKVLIEMGYQVSGSDMKESRYTRALTELGADISISHHERNLKDAGLVVISSAIPERNSELKWARSEKIPVLARAQMLNEVCAKKDPTIAIAGTHGKTTTTSMTALILDRVGLDPTFLIGGELNDIGSNARNGSGGVCVVEADESDGSLIYLNPKYAVITNIDTDHLDHYDTFDQLMELFGDWLGALPEDGKAIVMGDGSFAEMAAKSSGCEYITFGREETNDIYFSDPVFEDFASEFTVHDREKGRKWRIKLNVPGEHNILNALAALTVARSVQVDIGKASQVLSEFSGVKRRFQLVGRSGEVSIIDDYAHHPTEVIATLEAARNGGWKRIICIFQPHRFSRTKLLHSQFGPAFANADIIVMTDIYNAGELPVPGVTGKLLVDEVLSHQPHSRVAYIPNKLEIRDYVLSIVQPGDVVLTLGAGDIWSIGLDVFEYLRDVV
ncbi:MAG TPA: UDP-N-acetylmuramate--L-alanine ligase [Actinobacteria bacterium]|nr:UDP-N-acetylmuramate--L-alanine ligase [Actinomycetota bacterium]